MYKKKLIQNTSMHMAIHFHNCLKSLGPIDRKFHGHGENYGIVLYEYIMKQFSSFCKYTNIGVMKKMSNNITCKQ